MKPKRVAGNIMVNNYASLVKKTHANHTTDFCGSDKFVCTFVIVWKKIFNDSFL